MSTTDDTLLVGADSPDFTLPGRPGSLTRTTAELCAVPSVTCHEAALAADVLGRLKELPADRGEAIRIGDSVILRPHRRPGVPLVILAGHLDTVPPRQDRPINVKGDWLEGCGASDMKAALAVMLHLAHDVRPDEQTVDIGHVYYAREEGPYHDNHLGELLELEPLLSQADLVVCMEPTDNELQVGAVGSIHARLAFAGRRAHSARPWHGENAVHKAAPLLSRLAARAPVDVVFDGLTFREVAEITMVVGGGTRNVVPDHFEINLNYRFAPGKSLDVAVQDVEAIVDGDATITFTDLSPSGRVCTDNPLVRRLMEQTGPATPKQAWTDVARFSELGVDAVNFGPGATAQAHQRNEGVSVSAIEKNYAMMRSWLTSS